MFQQMSHDFGLPRFKLKSQHKHEIRTAWLWPHDHGGHVTIIFTYAFLLILNQLFQYLTHLTQRLLANKAYLPLSAITLEKLPL